MVQKVAFEVVSEFIFEEAVALTATNALTKSVEKLSKKTDEAIFGVARLGAAYAKNFLTQGGGLLGFLGAAVSSTEKFRNTQIELANTMIANGFVDANGNILDFNNSMIASEGILKNISKEAKKANLTTGQLAASTKLFANFLAPKGAAGKNLSNAVELARVSVKAGAALNLDQANIQQQIANAIGGNLSKGTLFGSRLFAESGDVLEKQFGIKTLKQFNVANVETRVKALTAALDKLAGGAEVIEARSTSLTQRLIRIKDLLFGLDSVIRPLGNTLIRIIGPLLDEVAKQIEKKGPLIVAIANNLFTRLGESPKEMFINIKSFANLHGDVTRAGKALRFLATSILILGAAASIGSVKSFTKSLIKMRGVVGFLALSFAKFSRVFTGLLGTGLISKFALIIPTFALLTGVFQVLSRTAEKSRLAFLNLLDVFSGKFLMQINRFINLIGLIFEPFNFVIEAFSDFLSQSFLLDAAFSIALGAFNKFNNILQTFAIIVQSVFIVFKTLGAAIGGFLGNIVNLIQNPSLLLSGEGLKSIFTAPFEAGAEELDRGVKSVVDRLLNQKDGSKVVAEQPKIDAKINNVFNMKEKIEPDRIAFTMEDQLRKLSENRRSSVGSPLIPTGG